MNAHFINKKRLMAVTFLALAVSAYSIVCLAESVVDSKLPNNHVCMINNEYMGKEQIPVSVNGKTYFGCCSNCAVTLRNDSTSRSAKDPYSGEAVDKADAFIALKPDSTTEVHYFKSEQNYINYVKSCSANNLRKLKNEE